MVSKWRSRYAFPRACTGVQSLSCGYKKKISCFYHVPQVPYSETNITVVEHAELMDSCPHYGLQLDLLLVGVAYLHRCIDPHMWSFFSKFTTKVNFEPIYRAEGNVKWGSRTDWKSSMMCQARGIVVGPCPASASACRACHVVIV